MVPDAVLDNEFEFANEFEEEKILPGNSSRRGGNNSKELIQESNR